MSEELISRNNLPQNLQNLFLKAMSAMETNNPGYAVTLLQRIIQEVPSFLEGRQLLRSAAARATSGQAKKSGLSLSSPAAKIKGMIKKDPQAAIVEAEKYLAEDPLSVDLNEMLFEAAEKAGMFETAAFALETLREWKKDKSVVKQLHRLGDHYLVTMQDPGRAATVFQDISERDPSDGSAAKKARDASANASMKKGGWSEGASLKDLVKDQAATQKQERASQIGMTREQMEARLADLAADYEQDPNNLIVVKQIGDIYEKMEDWQAAKSYYEWAFSLSSGDVAIKRKVEKLEDAIREQSVLLLEEEIASGTLTADEIEEKREVLAELQRAQIEQRIAEARTRVEGNPTDPVLRFELGQFLFDGKFFTEAIPELQRAKANPALRIKSMVMLGKCCEKKKMFDIAVNHFSEAIAELHAMDQTKKDALYNLGHVYQQMGKSEEALAQWKEIYNSDYEFRDVAQLVESSYA